MNRSESANFHNSMESIYQRTLLATNSKNYIPIAIGEFAKELYENPSCQHIRDVLQKEGQQVFMPFQKARSETLTTFTQAIAALKNHNTKPIDLSDLLNIIDDIQSNVHLTETERLYALLKPIEEAYNLLVRNAQNNSMDHSAVLNQLNYQPMLQKYFHEEQILERLIKTATFNSFHYLTKNYALNYDLRKKSNRINSFTDDTANYLNKESNNFDEALEAQTNQNALLQDFDTEECKIHVDRVRSFINTKVVIPANKKKTLSKYEYSYSNKNDCRIGTLSLSQEPQKTFEGISAALLYLMLQQKNLIAVDEILNNPKLQKIIGESISKKQLGTARETINKIFIKYFPKSFITATNGFWQINPLYCKLIKLLK